MSEDRIAAADVPAQIDVNQLQTVQLWCERLGVSEYALRQAVADVGVSAEQVAVHLGKR